MKRRPTKLAEELLLTHGVMAERRRLADFAVQ
jgi:hypothetical protein